MKAMKATTCTWAHDVRLHISYPKELKELNRQKKERNISAHKLSMTHRVLRSCRTKMYVIYMQS